MKKYYLGIFLFSILGFYSCEKEESLAQTKLLENKTFSEGLRIKGHDFDSLIIDNCTFEGKALNIGEVDYVLIKNCTFKNIKDNGLKIGFIGPSSNIMVENCTFTNISSNGIDSHEDAPNCSINNCTFENTAQSDIGAAMGQPHHAIYWKGKNVSITNSTFIGGDQEFGNGISVRSSGLISGNKVEGYPINGITYFSDHPGEDSLIIENNFLWNNSYSIALTTNGNESYYNKNIIVRFNSMVQNKNYSIYISNQFIGLTNIYVYGNILVNPSAEYIKQFNDDAILNLNLESKTDIGFMDMANGDLHILNSSIANGFCSSLGTFPTTDIDGDLRSQTNLDAGADENN